MSDRVKFGLAPSPGDDNERTESVPEQAGRIVGKAAPALGAAAAGQRMGKAAPALGAAAAGQRMGKAAPALATE